VILLSRSHGNGIYKINIAQKSIAVNRLAAESAGRKTKTGGGAFFRKNTVFVLFKRRRMLIYACFFGMMLI
jgi:hypothetical protein